MKKLFFGAVFACLLMASSVFSECQECRSYGSPVRSALRSPVVFIVQEKPIRSSVVRVVQRQPVRSVGRQILQNRPVRRIVSAPFRVCR